jgi:hypothetical protein
MAENYCFILGLQIFFSELLLLKQRDNKKGNLYTPALNSQRINMITCASTLKIFSVSQYLSDF